MTGTEFFGGGSYLDLSAVESPAKLWRSARVWTVLPDGSPRHVQMPDARLLQLGGPHFIILNLSGTFQFGVNTQGQTNGDILSLGTSDMVMLWLTDNTTATGVWSYIAYDKA